MVVILINLDIKENKSMTYCSIFLLLTFVLLKDLFKISTFFLPFNINYIVLPFYLIFSLYCLFGIFKKKNINLLVLLNIIFFIWNALTLIVHYLLNNVYGYSLFNLLISIFFQSIIPLTLVLSAYLYPNIMLLAMRTTSKFIYIALIIFSITILGFFLKDAQFIINFFISLMEKNLIVNPLQTHSEGVQLRYSGIFYSAYTMALFCCALIIFNLYDKSKGFSKFIHLFVLLGLLFVTLNRNGIVVCIISILLFLVWRYLNSKFIKTIAIFFFIMLTVVLYIPFLLHVTDVSLSKYDTGGMFTKLGTLAVRFDAWKDFLSLKNINDILFGKGFVQGIAETDFYIDNGFYYFISQNGLFSLLLYLSTTLIAFTRLVNINKRNCSGNTASASALVLLLCGCFSMFLNNSFYENIFLVYFWIFPLLVIFHDERMIRSERS
ncbi:hypothetical protein A2I96_06500 [Pseudoalteromonas tetraodonis]|uniref:O-antigen ligase-related domain-containing protein n=1 Tax=Pseudoalteromonas tetraodonis TaxID=43659 RepID=A0ABD4ESL8_9GAMM|nr:hypothetical protein A2I96_06500 [Pseudoalteromonas spiralis]